MRSAVCVLIVLSFASCSGAPSAPAPSAHSAELARLEQQVATDRAARPQSPVAATSPAGAPPGDLAKYSSTTEWKDAAAAPPTADAAFLVRASAARRTLDDLRSAAKAANPADGAEEIRMTRHAADLREAARTPVERNLGWLLVAIVTTDKEHRRMTALKGATSGTTAQRVADGLREEADIAVTCRAEFDEWMRVARIGSAAPADGRCLGEMRKAAALLGEP